MKMTRKLGLLLTLGLVLAVGLGWGTFAPAQDQSQDQVQDQSPGMEQGGEQPTAEAQPGDSADQNGEGLATQAENGGLSGQVGMQQAAAYLNRLGLSMAEAQEIRTQAANGTLSAQQAEQLCGRIVAAGFSAAELQSFDKMLGLNTAAAAQLRQCTGLSEETARPTRGGRQPAAAPSPESVPSPSQIERDFAGLANPEQTPEVPSPLHLTQFGYSLFDKNVSTFAPVSQFPVGSDYILGPGDEVVILMWGRVNRTLHLPVDREGAIAIPEVGPLQVSGLNFDQAKHLIEARLDQITGVQADVTMGRLRSIQVSIVGEVKQPGIYTVSSLAHVSNVLAAAGGVTKVGSLRRVEVRRNNRLFKVLDIYAMLMRGDSTDDIRLQAQDVVFVPVVGAVVGVVGDVKRPAIYELAGRDQGLRGVIALAGGINAFGYAQRIQVERIQNHERSVVLDITPSQSDFSRFLIHDGDLVKVYPVLSQQENTVILRGNVYRPGVYQWRPGMAVSDLVNEGEGISKDTFLEYALIQREEGRERKIHYLPVNLRQALSGSSPNADVPLQARDQLIVYNIRQMGELEKVLIYGEVRKPGRYPLKPGMRIADLIYMAGGPRSEAYLETAELARTKVINGARTLHTYIDVDLRQALSGIDDQNMALQNNDELFIRSAPNWHMPLVVSVEGQVLKPGPYPVQRGERLSSVLKRCGGLLPDAFFPGMVFTRLSVKAVEQKRISESVERLKAGVIRLQLQPTSSGQDNKEVKVGTEVLQQIIDQAKSTPAQGRLVLHLTTVADLPGSPDDLTMEDGDSLTIPKMPNAVFVLGQVYTPTTIVFRPGRTVRDYLQQAGGMTESADTDAVLLVRANGSVVTEQGVKDSGKSHIFPLLPVVSGGLMDERLEPGDTIYVPEKLMYVSKLQTWKDVTQIIANSAIALGTLGLLAIQH